MRMTASDQVSEMTSLCTIPLTCSEKTWLDDDFGHLVFRVHSAVTHSISHRLLPELNVTAAQGRLLYIVSWQGLRHATQISRECGVDLTAVTRLIDRLVRAGLLVRTRSTVDRRVNCLVLTERGQSVADRIPAILADVHRTLLAGFSADEVTLFKQMLLRMQ